MANQNAWRFCQKCHSMFYDGYADKGHCAAGGGHEAQGFMFFLPHDVPVTPASQDQWRYCDKCHVMFYDGYPDKGVCAAGGGHQAQGYMFLLPHDIAPTATAQNAWRYCQKCHSMFYDGYADKAHCPAGGGHQAQGYMFILPHDISGSLRWDFNSITFPSGVAAGGNAHLTLSQDGTYSFSGHFHDSGAAAYDMAIVLSVKDSQNRLYTFAASGRIAGTFESGSRDWDWNTPGKNQAIADNWVSIAAGSDVHEHCDANLDLASLFDVVKQAAGVVVQVVEVVGPLLA